MISGLIQLLNTDADFQEICEGQKAYPVRAPEKIKRPYVVLRRTSAPPIEYKTAPSEIDKPAFNVVVYAESYKKAEDISNVIRGILDGYVGGSYKAIWYTDAEDLFDPDDGNSGSVVISNKYRAMVVNTI